MEKLLARHIKDNLGIYMVIFFFFLGGIVFGTISLNFLGEQQLIQLAAYLDNLLRQFNTGTIKSDNLFYHAALDALKETGLIWFLGLTVIGIPLIIIFVFIKGFVLGFTVGFLIKQKAVHGLALSLTAVMPANLLQIPALFLAAMLGISFSTGLIRGRIWERGILPGLLNYSLCMLLVAVLLAGGGLVEAYLAPVFIRLVLAYI